jgi:LuxR family transcriptional regulator, maltose regulon positive regulatory protein
VSFRKDRVVKSSQMPARKSRTSASRLLERPRLLHALLEANDQKLIALLAPAGYGKTTLAKQYIEKKKAKSVWLTLREDAADANLLSQDFMYEARRVMPKLKFPHTEEALKIAARANRLGVMLARDLNALSTNLHLVFDRIEFLSSSSSPLLEGLIEELGEGHQVILTGYEGTNLPVASYTAQGFARLFIGTDLNFTAEESNQLFAALGSRNDASEAHKNMDGWPLGLAVLSSSDLKNTSPDKVMQNLFNRLPEAVQTWLPELAPLKTWGVESTKQLGCDVPDDWSIILTRIGLPFVQMNAPECMPHSLLSDLLEQKLKLKPERHSKLHITAGFLAEQMGQDWEALWHYQSAGSTSDSLRVIDRLSDHYQKFREHDLARQALEVVTKTDLPNHLLVRLAVQLYKTGDLIKGEEILVALYDKGYRNQYVLKGLAQLEFEKNNINASIKFADEGFRIADSDMARAEFLIQKGYGLISLKKVGQAADIAETAEDFIRTFTDSSDQADAYFRLGTLYGMLDDHRKSEKFLLLSVRSYEDLDASLNLQTCYINLSNLYLNTGEMKKARGFADKGISISDKANSYWLATLFHMSGSVFMMEAKFSEAIKEYKKSIDFSEKFKQERLREASSFLMMHANLLGKNTGEYLMLKDASNSSFYSANLNQYDYFIFNSALYEFCNGDYEKSKNFFLKMGTPTDQLTQLRISAYLTDIARRTGKAWKSMAEHLFQQLTQLQQDNALVPDKFLLAGFFEECIRLNLYKNRLKSMLDLQSDQIFLSKPLIHLKMIGGFWVFLNNQEIKISLQKSKELLLWLAIQGASSRSEIIQALWGEPETPKNREYFKTAIRKLRTSLLENTIIRVDPVPFSNGMYQLHESIMVHWDHQTLQERFEKNTYTEDDVLLAQQYSKAFLQNFKPDWVQEFKQSTLEHLHQVIVHAAQDIRQSAAEKALRLYECAIELEPLAEEAYVELAKLFRSLKRHDEANRTKQRFAQALQAN